MSTNDRLSPKSEKLESWMEDQVVWGNVMILRDPSSSGTKKSKQGTVASSPTKPSSPARAATSQPAASPATPDAKGTASSPNNHASSSPAASPTTSANAVSQPRRTYPEQVTPGTRAHRKLGKASPERVERKARDLIDEVLGRKKSASPAQSPPPTEEPKKEEPKPEEPRKEDPPPPARARTPTEDGKTEPVKPAPKPAEEPKKEEPAPPPPSAAPRSVSPAPPFPHKGWIQKFSVGKSTLGSKNWQRRFFVFNDEGLHYYEKETDAAEGGVKKAKGNVKIFLPTTTMTSHVTKELHEESADATKELLIHFEDSGAKLKLLLKFDSVSDKNTWAKVLAAKGVKKTA